MRESSSLISLQTALYRPANYPTGVIADMAGMSDPQVGVDFRNRYSESYMAERDLVYVRDEFIALDPDRFHRDALARYGFGVYTPLPPVAVELSPNTEYLGGLTDDEIEHWYGELDDCRDRATEAESAVFQRAAEALGPDLMEEIASIRVLAHPQLQPALKQWSSCMRDRAWPLDHPFQVEEQLSRLASADDPAQDESTLAVDNFDCAEMSLRPALRSLVSQLEVEAQEVMAVESIYSR